MPPWGEVRLSHSRCRSQPTPDPSLAGRGVLARYPALRHQARVTARRHPFDALRNFITSEAAGGLVLMGAAAIAIAVANSPLAPGYFAARQTHFGSLTALHWVNDGLMALFFLFVGLEIKRELVDGQLSTWERRRLPGLAAAAGMAVPALIYAGINHASPGALRGWAIPSATDIAFALGVLALLGKRVPTSLKVLLTAIAVLDDMGAVAIIAGFYTDRLRWTALGIALGGLALLALANRMGVRALWAYLLPAPAIWWAMHLSGVHATIAGVLLAAVIPLDRAHGHPDDRRSPLHRLEHALGPWVAFGVVPIFGFANAGVSFAGITRAMATSGVTLGIAAGLFLGKQAGIHAAIRLAVRARLAARPAGANWRQVYGVALLCGIGFTMSLFVGDLAFRGVNALEDEVKLGVLAGSLLSTLSGVFVLAWSDKLETKM